MGLPRARLAAGSPSATLLSATLLSATLLVSACGSQSPVPTDRDIGALHGRVGPGAPPSGDVPAELEVVFTRGDDEVRTIARDGEYALELPVGTWDVRTADELACADDVVVQGAVRLRQDLSYPGDCPGPS